MRTVSYHYVRTLLTSIRLGGRVDNRIAPDARVEPPQENLWQSVTATVGMPRDPSFLVI